MAAADAVERVGARDWAQTEAADRVPRAVHQPSLAVPDLEAAGDLASPAEFVTRGSR